MNGKPEVFIIESLRLDDERNNRFEGQIISQILALSGKKCEYYYVRTSRELKRFLAVFTRSKYRYLHLSCHGDPQSMATTFDTLTLAGFADLVRPHLESKRLFVSACAMTNETLAKEIIPDSGCFSILGPDENIAFNDAAILWASLYHVLFTADPNAITRVGLTAKAQEVSNMYRVRLKLFVPHRGSYKRITISPEPESG